MGVMASLLIGPLFFLLLQVTVERGRKAGIICASGIWFSDVIYNIIVWLTMDYLSTLPGFNKYVGIFGGSLLFVFGLYMIFTRVRKGRQQPISYKEAGGFFSAGFSINTFNPFVLLLWVSIYQSFIAWGLIIQQRIAFVVSLLFVVICFDCLKVFLAEKLSQQLKDQHFQYIRKGTALALMVFAVILILRVI